MGDGDKAINRDQVEQAAKRFERKVGHEVDEAKTAHDREDLGTSMFTSVLWRLAAAYEVTDNFMARQLQHNRDDVTGVKNRLLQVKDNYKKAEDNATMPD